MDLFASSSSSCDPEYGQLRDLPQFAERRYIINSFYDQFKPYADRNFADNFSREFFPRFWEMYLGCSLLNSGLKLKPRKDMGRVGPDFCITEEDKKRIWIEAVTISSGTGPDAIALIPSEDEEEFHEIPEERIVLRFCSAISNKYRTYLRYLSLGIVRPDEPFLIAVSGAGRGVSIQDWGIQPDIPFAIRAVLPVGQYTVTIDRGTNKVRREGPSYRHHILKRSGSLVPTTSFLDCTSSLISALVFSNVHPTFSNKVPLGKISLLHNRNSLNPVKEGWLGTGDEWQIREDQKRGNYILRPTKVDLE